MNAHDRGEKATVRVTWTPLFRELVQRYQRKHPKLAADMKRFAQYVARAPMKVGERLVGVSGLPRPLYKSRSKDSCHRLGARGGWRILYDVDEHTFAVRLLFLYHKRELDNPRTDFLVEQLKRALASLP